MMRRPIRRRTPAPDALPGLALPPVLRRVYAARGVSTATELDLRLELLQPVGSLDGVEAAVDLLLSHRKRGSRVLVIGDYDADGATATAVVVRALRQLDFPDVEFLVPDRFRHGYGLTPGIVAVAATLKPGLIITVDNGIASLAGVAEARRHGIDVLVTDHHLPGETLPDAILVNPNLPGSRFASPALAGVGVAFYVMAALARRLGGRSAAIAGLLDLVALGTVADVVPLDHNNRILVHQGLQRIRAGRCVPGIAALAAVAGRSLTRVSATDLGFFLGPRLNAAGRLEDMSVGIRCLLTDDPAEAAALAAELDRLNRERRAIETRMQEEALAAVRRLRLEQPGAQLPPALALFDADWHQGVVGLVASRVRERVHRPVIAFAPADDGQLRGSARSVPGVHVRDVLAAIDARHPTLIERYGGHAMAAGLTLAPDHLERFTRAFADEVGRSLDPALLQGTLVTDGELAAAEFSLETAEQLRAGGPWGQAFPEPLFDGEYPVLEARVLGERHLKLWVRPDLQSPPQEAIAFGWLDGEPRPVPRAAERVHLVFRLDVNDYLGMRRPQLVVDYLERR